MCDRALDILAIEPRVKADGFGECFDQFMSGFCKTATPEFFVLILLVGLVVGHVDR
jgi:hypothetical protein